MNSIVARQQWVPHKFQESGIKFLALNQEAILSWKPGLGKTSTILEAFRMLKKADKAKRMLVLGTVRICQLTWPDEIKKWAQFEGLTYQFVHGSDKEYILRHSKADILLMNYEGLLQLANLIPADIDVFVYDELTKMKNHNSKRYKLLKPYMHKPKYRWGATGSLLSNNHLTLFGQIYCIDIGEALSRYVTHYRAKYFTQVPNDFHKFELNPGAAEAIAEKIKHLVHHVDQEDWLRLPDLFENIQHIVMPPEVRKQYWSLREEFILLLKEGVVTAANAGVLVSKLRQFTGGALYDSERLVHEVHDLKLEVLSDLVEDLDGDPLLIAVHYKHEVDRIKKYLGREIPYFGGGITDEEAERIKTMWNAGMLPLIAAHPASVAHGLNMQDGGANIFWFSPEGSLEAYEQLVARLHRQGQKRTVIVTTPVMTGTIDELIVKTQQHRGDQQEYFFSLLKTEL